MVEEIITAPAEVLVQLGQIGLWLQAIGLVIVAWIAMQIISFLYNQRRMREIGNIKKDMVRIEAKIDQLIGSRKK